jgi:hypothetical protein
VELLPVALGGKPAQLFGELLEGFGFHGATIVETRSESSA